MFQRRRLRIICHLPVTTTDEEEAVLAFLGYLEEEARVYALAKYEHEHAKIGRAPSGFEGYTFTVLPPSFAGFWLEVKSPDAKLGAMPSDAAQSSNAVTVKSYEEPIVVCVVDYLGRDSPGRLISALAAKVDVLYKEIGKSPQAELWVVAHPVVQYEQRKAVPKSEADQR